MNRANEQAAIEIIHAMRAQSFALAFLFFDDEAWRKHLWRLRKDLDALQTYRTQKRKGTSDGRP